MIKLIDFAARQR